MDDIEKLAALAEILSELSDDSLRIFVSGVMVAGFMGPQILPVIETEMQIREARERMAGDDCNVIQLFPKT